MALTRLNSDTLSINAVTDTALNSTGVIAGTYGNSSHIPSFTVDEDGRITSANSNEITNLTLNTLYTIGDVNIGGNLNITGNTTVINSTTMHIADNTITLNAGIAGTYTQNSGLIISRGNNNDVSLVWNEADESWKLTKDGIYYYNLTTDNSSLDATKLVGNVAVGTVTNGTWNANNISIQYGGTGASTAAAARTNLGIDDLTLDGGNY
jgi:hypothetical protein